MIPLLLDAGLPKGAALDLRAAGWDVVHVSEIALGAASDAAILAAGERLHRVVATLDHDFARLLYLSGARFPSLLVFRIEGLDRPAAVAAIRAVVPLVVDDLRAGAVVSVSVGSARVRRLPIANP